MFLHGNKDFVTQTPSCSQNSNLSFGEVLSISVLNNYQNKKKKKKKKNVSHQAPLQSTIVAFEVMACQYLGATDRQQFHLRTISPFQYVHCWANRRRRKDLKKKQKKNKTECVKWILSSPVISMRCWNAAGTRRCGQTVTMSFSTADERVSSHPLFCVGLFPSYRLI